MSDLSQWLRDPPSGGNQHASGPYGRARMIEAADALDAKDAALAEAQATIEAMEINHASLGKRALRWQDRAEAAEARIATLEGAVSFLIDRLGEYEVPEEGSRDWFGHVVPALERLAALATDQPQESAADAFVADMRERRLAHKDDGMFPAVGVPYQPPCPECEGRGYVTDVQDDPYMPGVLMEDRPCPACKPQEDQP